MSVFILMMTALLSHLQLLRFNEVPWAVNQP